MAIEPTFAYGVGLTRNQRDREQMCRSILALDRRYTEIRPRHLSGGPDGGRDHEALFDRDRVAFGAVGFATARTTVPSIKPRREKFEAQIATAPVWVRNTFYP
jgi:hypothetical protein